MILRLKLQLHTRRQRADTRGYVTDLTHLIPSVFSQDAHRQRSHDVNTHQPHPKMFATNYGTPQQCHNMFDPNKRPKTDRNINGARSVAWPRLRYTDATSSTISEPLTVPALPHELTSTFSSAIARIILLKAVNVPKADSMTASRCCLLIEEALCLGRIKCGELLHDSGSLIGHYGQTHRDVVLAATHAQEDEQPHGTPGVHT